MISFPHCKINLGLHVVAKRPDGFHDIETCFYPVPWTDILEIIPSQETRFDSSGIAIPGLLQDNLCMKAYHLLKQNFDLPSVNIHLHKLLPTGAGLGGGSSDAAFALRMLNQIFKLNLSTEALSTYASAVGSDCSFFIQGNAMMGTGRGEILHPLKVSLKGKYLVLVKPDVQVSTAEAYAGVVPKRPAHSIRAIETKSLNIWKDFLVNDFEASVFIRFPQIAELKKELYNAGAVYASMSGSGASVFGIFDKTIDVRSQFKGMTFWSGTLSV